MTTMKEIEAKPITIEGVMEVLRIKNWNIGDESSLVQYLQLIPLRVQYHMTCGEAAQYAKNVFDMRREVYMNATRK